MRLRVHTGVVNDDGRRHHGGRRLAKGRVEAFSDGIFAIAITLLVLDLVIPASRPTVDHLLAELAGEWPAYLGYFVSFSTIGALWLGHNAITDYLEHADATFLRLNLVLLLFVAFLPFPTRLLSDFTGTPAEPVAATVYGVSLLVCTGLLSALWRYALHAELISPEAEQQDLALLTRRLSPSLLAYVVLIAAGIFFPLVAVGGYLVIAVFLFVPARRRRSRGAGGAGGAATPAAPGAPPAPAAPAAPAAPRSRG